MSKMLTAGEQPIAKVFSDDYVFTIPGYQRPYAWTIEEAGELFDDLYAAMRAPASDVSDLQPYFLGSIVLIKKDESPAAEVVDGQQRLTTLTLLLAAIRARLADDNARADLSKRICAEGDVFAQTEKRYRLDVRERDQSFFRQYVQDAGGINTLTALDGKLPDNRNNLRENARLLLARIEGLSADERFRLARFIVTRCYLVVVCTPSRDSAYRIFDILNSRGLNLSATDILKAEIIGKIAEVQRGSYTKSWEDIESELGRDDFGNLFSHIRMIYRKAKPQGTLLKEFHDHVPCTPPEAFVDKTLVPLAEAYRVITDEEYSSQSGAEAVNENLRWLNRIEFKDWMPPALAFLAAHRNEPQQVLQFFGNLERLVYAMLIAKWGVNERIDRCSKLTAAIQSSTDLSADDSPLLVTPHEKRAAYDALNGPLYATHSARALATILLRLDALLSSAGATYDHSIVSIEHVLPQNPAPDSEWITWFPDDDQRASWVNRLGNLTLLSRRKNSSANNYGFTHKKDAYFTKNGVSPFAMTTEVLQHAEWTSEVVKAIHEKRLATFEAHLELQDRAASPIAPNPDKSAPELADIDRLFYCRASEANAQARCRREGVWVLTGSTGRAEVVDSLNAHHGYKELRAELLAAGIIVSGGDGRIRFAKDHRFNSPSAAAVAVTGRSANGWTEWRDEQGMTLRDACAKAAVQPT